MDSHFDDAAECDDFKQLILTQDLMFQHMQEMDNEDDELAILAKCGS
jgi:hypothetical protein